MKIVCHPSIAATLRVSLVFEHGLMGIEIFESPLCVARERQVRFPKSKKKRIRRKWSARDRNWRFKPMAYRVELPAARPLPKSPYLPVDWMKHYLYAVTLRPSILFPV